RRRPFRRLLASPGPVLAGLRGGLRDLRPRDVRRGVSHSAPPSEAAAPLLRSLPPRAVVSHQYFDRELVPFGERRVEFRLRGLAAGRERLVHGRVGGHRHRPADPQLSHSLARRAGSGTRAADRGRSQMLPHRPPASWWSLSDRLAPRTPLVGGGGRPRPADAEARP